MSAVINGRYVSKGKNGKGKGGGKWDQHGNQNQQGRSSRQNFIGGVGLSGGKSSSSSGGGGGRDHFFIYIGEWCTGMTGSKEFHMRLLENWKCIFVKPVSRQWFSTCAVVSVWRKKEEGIIGELRGDASVAGEMPVPGMPSLSFTPSIADASSMWRCYKCEKRYSSYHRNHQFRRLKSDRSIVVCGETQCLKKLQYLLEEVSPNSVKNSVKNSVSNSVVKDLSDLNDPSYWLKEVGFVSESSPEYEVLREATPKA